MSFKPILFSQKLYNWVALFSQTGTEICDIIDRTEIKPASIVTNALEENINPRIFSFGIPIYYLPLKPTIDQYFSVLPKNSDCVITLHGWLKIIPAEVCNAYEDCIFNGHPALIGVYPDLKGFNKQEAVLDHVKYESIGSVIHKVIPELDAGTVLYSCSRLNTATSIDQAYALLRETSLQTWERFFLDRVLPEQGSVKWMYRENFKATLE